MKDTQKTFKFIDLFAGIGGFHLAMHSLGGRCVFASEIDKHARITYEQNFKEISPELFDNGLFNEDIREVSPNEIPDFDVLCAGFPCQPFSQAGFKRGFQDNHKSERGNLVFSIVDILEAKKPKAFFLENVRGLINHDNGKTFEIIKTVLIKELGYSFYHKVVKASDYGLPQLRPRVFMIGFKNDSSLPIFSFPEKKDLKFNMSDVWQASCSREVGFTIRVGGRGSKIDDRRNWDAYLVNGDIKKLMPKQAKKMQGFPDKFSFPVSDTEAMKQLGNSVAIDAIKECSKSMLKYLDSLDGTKIMMKKNTKNKGEWTEIYIFLKVLHERKLFMCDSNLILNKNNYFDVKKVTTLNIKESFFLHTDSTVTVKNEESRIEKDIAVDKLLNQEVFKLLIKKIKDAKGTFNIPEFEILQNHLGLTIVKGGNSNQKSDIILDLTKDAIYKENEGFGIKSFLGNKPTLLNASGNTNFIYEVKNLDLKHLDNINSIETKTKLKDRIKAIYQLGGFLEFFKVEKDTMNYNLEIIDSNMPIIVSQMILEFFVNHISSLKENVSKVSKSSNYDLKTIEIKVKRLLITILLGFFAGKKWDGNFNSKGIIVVKENGEQVVFHIINQEILEAYLLENIKFDTPSTTRHRYGSLIIENNNKIYFKLNMQLRF